MVPAVSQLALAAESSLGCFGSVCIGAGGHRRNQISLWVGTSSPDVSDLRAVTATQVGLLGGFGTAARAGATRQDAAGAGRR
jgi:Na+/glutamate symporter